MVACSTPAPRSVSTCGRASSKASSRAGSTTTAASPTNVPPGAGGRLGSSPPPRRSVTVLPGRVPTDDPVGQAERAAVGDSSRHQATVHHLLVAWRDAWRILRGGPPVATALRLAVVRPADDTVAARNAARLEDRLRWSVWLRALRDGTSSTWGGWSGPSPTSPARSTCSASRWSPTSATTNGPTTVLSIGGRTASARSCAGPPRKDRAARSRSRCGPQGRTWTSAAAVPEAFGRATRYAIV